MIYINLLLIIFAIAALTFVAQISYAQTSCTDIDDCTSDAPTCVDDPEGDGKICTPVLCMQDSDCADFEDTNSCVDELCQFSPGLGAVVDAVVVTANDPETGACEIGEVHPDTGTYSKMFDAGCNECGGIDTDDNGNLIVACGDDDAPLDTGIAKRTLLTGSIVEFDAQTGHRRSANIHGRSNYISDIAVLPNRVVISHETLDEDTVHEHDRLNNFLANPIGPTGLEVERAGLSYFPDMKFYTLATNVDGQPALYQIDPDTGEAMFNIALRFPTISAASGSNISSRAIAVADIRVAALDAMALFAGTTEDVISAGASEKTRAGLVPVEDADYIVLLTKDDPMTGAQDGWAAFGLIDHETGLVDHVIEIRSERDLQFTGLTVRQPIQRNVPTLSEWGLIATAVILGFIGVLVIRRRKFA